MKQSTRTKKPIHKRWWVWLLAAFIAIGAIGGGEDAVQDNSSDELGVIAEAPPIDDKEVEADTITPVIPKVEKDPNELEAEKPDEPEQVIENTEETVTGPIENITSPANTEITQALKAHFIDVGQADSIFIELPNGETMLIDAGNSKNGNQIVNYIKSMGYNRLDYVVATHPHADHIGGMTSVINGIKIGKFFMPEKEHTTKTFESMIDALASNNIDVFRAKAGTDIISINGLQANILSPVSSYGDDLNNWSAVVKVVYKNNSFLLMGDAESKVEGQLSNIDVDVLKVGHHGSDTSSGLSFLQKVTPEHAIISVGAGNSYGHPTQSTLSNLGAVGAKVYRTDLLGTVIVSSDGNNITVNKNAGEALAVVPNPTPEPKPNLTPTPSPAPQPKPEPDPTPEPVIGTVVYITKTGEKYHRDGCSSLSKSKIEIELADAQGRGYEPCKKCKP